MPDYNDYYRGLQRRPGPVSSFISGFGAAEDIQTSALKRAVQQRALDRETEKQAALKQFQTTGDPTVLYPTMEPKEAAMLPGSLDKLSAENEKTRAEAVDKALGVYGMLAPTMTLDTWEGDREHIMKTLPSVPPSLLPPKESFDTPEKFENYKKFLNGMYERQMSLRYPALEAAKIKSLQQQQSDAYRRGTSLLTTDMRTREQADRTAAFRERTKVIENKPVGGRQPKVYSDDELLAQARRQAANDAIFDTKYEKLTPEQKAAELERRTQGRFKYMKASQMGFNNLKQKFMTNRGAMTIEELQALKNLGSSSGVPSGNTPTAYADEDEGEE